MNCFTGRASGHVLAFGQSAFRAALLLCGLCVAISGQTPSPCTPNLPPWLLPGEENYSALRNSPDRDAGDPDAGDPLDRLHYLPLNGPSGNSYLTLGGQVRQWFESFSTPPLGVGLDDPDGYLLQRYMAHADAHIGKRFRVFVEIKGNLENGRRGGPRPDIDEDPGDLHQAFFDAVLWRPTARSSGRSLTLRVGRQELYYGVGRFVNPREGPNVRQSFDGVKLSYCSSSWRVDAFAARPVLNRLKSFDDAPDHAASFWGVYATRLLPRKPAYLLDTFYFGLDQKISFYAGGQGRERRHTIGARFAKDGAGWQHDFEFVAQFGRFANRDIQAWSATVASGYAFEHVRYRPTLSVKADVASGDSGKPGTSLGTWNPLFPSLHYFGEEGIAGPANFYDFHPELETHPLRNLRLLLSTNWFWRQKASDGIYLPGPFLIVAPNGSTARYVGNLSAVEAEWEISRHWLATAYYSHFANGTFLNQAKPGSNLNYVAGWLTFHF